MGIDREEERYVEGRGAVLIKRKEWYRGRREEGGKRCGGESTEGGGIDM